MPFRVNAMLNDGYCNNDQSINTIDVLQFNLPTFNNKYIWRLIHRGLNERKCI